MNIGSPDAPFPGSVRAFLREFLSDGRVLDIPSLFRWLLLNTVILPFRPAKSAEAYAAIWNPAGSPLILNTRNFTERLQAALPPGFQVEIGMRYGNPSVAACLNAIKPDHVLFSFHGLPERQIRKCAHQAGSCLSQDDSCCESIGAENAFCYRAQCFSTAKGIAERLGLRREDYSITFQSRLGRTPWIGPFTESRLLELAHAGKKDVVVFCPSFTADCLETLEEISIRAKAKFIAGGGNSLTLVPSLNDSDTWVLAAKDMVLAALNDGEWR